MPRRALVQRGARRLAAPSAYAHGVARGALGLDERLQRLPGLRRGLRESATASVSSRSSCSSSSLP